MNIICPTSIQCPGSDSPILNVSSEAPDHFYWWNYIYPFNQCATRLNCDPTTYYGKDCFGVLYSATSQADADLQANLASVNCNPPGGGNTSCVNEEQMATAYCADGTPVTFTTPAGMFASSLIGSYDACLAAANAQALSYAQQQASALAQLDCPRTSCTIRTTSPLPSGSVNTPYLKAISGSVTGGAEAFTILSGTLPPGLSMNSAGLISGTPTTPGTYQFTVKLLNPTQSVSCSKYFDLTITSTTDVYACYKLDEATGANTLVDSKSGFNLSRSVGTFTSVSGKIGSAMELGNGINTRFENGPNNHFIFSGAFTVRFWFKKQLTGTNSFLFGVANQWNITYLTSEEKLEFAVRTTSGYIFIDTPPLVNGEWNYFVFSFQPGLGLKLVVNNAATFSTASTDPIQPYATDTLSLQNSHFWDSGNVIDDIAIWRRALTTAELLADWNSGSGKTCAACSGPSTLTITPAVVAAINAVPPGYSYTQPFTIITNPPFGCLSYSMVDTGNPAIDVAHINDYSVPGNFTVIIPWGWNGFTFTGGLEAIRIPASTSDPRGTYQIVSLTALAGYSIGDLITIT